MRKNDDPGPDWITVLFILGMLWTVGGGLIAGCAKLFGWR